MLKYLFAALSIAASASLLPACGDSSGDSDDDDDDGAGNSGNSGTGNSGNSGTGNSGNSGTGGDSGSVATCEDLCALAPVDTQTGNCVAEFIVESGYDVTDPACADTNNEPGCLACYGAIDVSDDDCIQAHTLCF